MWTSSKNRRSGEGRIRLCLAISKTQREGDEGERRNGEWKEAIKDKRRMKWREDG